MNSIDHIYYTATTTNLSPAGALTSYDVTTSDYFVPFFDLFFIFLVFILSIIAILVTDYFLYKKNIIIKIKNHIKLTKGFKKEIDF